MVKRKVYRCRLAALSTLMVCLAGLMLSSSPEPGPVPEPVSQIRHPAVEDGPAPPAPPVEDESAPPPSMETLEEKLRQVAQSYEGDYGVVVFDPASGRTAALNADETFKAASLAKLPVLITLYRAAARGKLGLRKEITLLPSDIQSYGTGVLGGYPPGHTMSLRKCATYLIEQSDNTAWAMLERRLGAHNIQAELQDLGADHTDYLTGHTTPGDVLLMLRAIADPDFTNPDLSTEMLDLMTGTAYEDRLPQPLPEGTRVAHKVGSYEDTYSDAGVVFYRDPHELENSYFIVVMAENTNERDARSAIRHISLTTYETLAAPSEPQDAS
jgi:beta-lactamase class A